MSLHGWQSQVYTCTALFPGSTHGESLGMRSGYKVSIGLLCVQSQCHSMDWYQDYI